jgi:twitching motility protein PilT
MSIDINDLFNQAARKRASDLHLVRQCPPLVRVDGILHPLAGMPALNNEDLIDVFFHIATPDQRKLFNHIKELDFALITEGGWYVRCNACKQQGTISMAFRLLPQKIPSIDELGLPAVCKELIMKQRGLVMITGPIGSGKSTTLAAMINYLNNTEHRYVVTIEDPIEYVHPNIKCAVSQRELAADTLSFANALKHILRQDPDVILVGEIRDLDTAAAVLSVAEVGHLILSTSHAPSAAQAIERIADLFPPEERPMSHSRIASVLTGVICQKLVPRIGGGRVAALEIMLPAPAIRSLIREGKTYQLENTIRTHARLGMQTMDEALVRLYMKKIITWNKVTEFCNDIEEAEKLARELGAIPV